jgi:uncharacterized membrane protein YedE/YeeE
MHPWLLALLGGVMIGVAGALLMATHGRIAGISGIVAGVVERRADYAWRIAFVAGLAIAGVGGWAVRPEAFGPSPYALPVIAIAGVLVGVGTRMGGGCTSGHGVCGLGRLSKRSLVAVATFIATAMLTVAIGGRL